jgi:hypothetical protein
MHAVIFHADVSVGGLRVTWSATICFAHEEIYNCSDATSQPKNV